MIPNGIDPSELVPVDDLDALRARFAAPDERLVLLVGRLVYEKGFQLALEALPGLIERLGDVRFIVAGSGTRGARAARAGARARPRRARHLPRLDRRRRAPLALPDRRPHGGALDLRAVRPGGARGDGVGLPLPRRRHRRAARGRAERGRGPALPLARPELARRRWPSACSPTTSCATGSWPRPPSTCSRFDWADVARRWRRSTARSARQSGARGALPAPDRALHQRGVLPGGVLARERERPGRPLERPRPPPGGGEVE